MPPPRTKRFPTTGPASTACSMDTPLHRESQTFYFRELLLAVVFGCFVAIVLMYKMPPPVAAFVLLNGLAVTLLVWSFTKLNIIVTPSEIRFGFAIYRKRFAAENVLVGDIEQIPTAAGIGVHRYRNRWVINARMGRGVALLNGKTRYLIGSNQPERLHAALLQVAKRGIVP